MGVLRKDGIVMLGYPGRTAGLVAMVLVLGGCGSGGPGTGGTPTPQETIAAPKLAIASLLPYGAVPPAPPGDTIVDAMGPIEVTGVIGEPSRQVMTCTPRELPAEDDPGPAEPDAAGAASAGFVTGVAQVDQFAIVYTDTAAAQRAVTRARPLAEDCDAAFAVHSPGAVAEATVASAPAIVDGFRVHATYAYDDTGYSSDEVSAVLRWGRTVLYLRANETGSPAGMDWETDGILDPEWVDRLVEAAAEHLAQ